MVMKNNKWNHDFPEVPDLVHQKVLSALADLENQEDKKMKTIKTQTMKTRTLIILAAALVILLGTTAVAAELFKWNEKATDIFVADPEQQDKLVMEQVAQESGQSVTDNGLTITAIQTIQDSNCFYALFEVTAQDTGLVIDADCGLSYKMDFPGAQDPFGYMGWGFIDSSRQEPGNSRYFEIYGTKNEESTEDLNMNLNFTALTGPGQKAMEGEALIEGNWNFSLTVHPAKPVRFDLNRKCQINGCEIYVESVELSPLTAKLVCSGADIKVLEDKEGINLEQADVLSSTMPTGVMYQDGSSLEESCTGLWERFDEDAEYVKVIRFDRVIEPEKVSSLLLGSNKDEIALR